MADAVIMLADNKKFNPEKAKYPLFVSEKIDGVACDFYTVRVNSKWEWRARSRTGEDVPAAGHIVRTLNDHVRPSRGRHIIGELHIHGKNFQYISGVSRRLVEDVETAQLVLHVYDSYEEGYEATDFGDRYNDILMLIPAGNRRVEVVLQRKVNNAVDYHVISRAIRRANATGRPTGSEGTIARTITGKDSHYAVNKRPKGFMKDKLVETIDIPLLGFEEAIDKKTKKGLGMVGRLISEIDGQPTGVGPGKLTHKERTRIFNEWPRDKGRTMEVTAMPDVGYKALREGRFENWRDDK